MGEVTTRARKMSSPTRGKKLRKRLTPSPRRTRVAVLGIDLSSTKLAMVLFIDGEYHSHFKTKFTGLLEVKGHVRSFLSPLPASIFTVARAYVEEAVVARGGNRVTIAQAYAMGAVRLTLEEMGWGVGLVNVSTWKKQVVGYGRADKHAISQWVEADAAPDIFRSFTRDQDVFDAYCVGRYGIRVVRAARAVDESRSLLGTDAPLLLSD